MAMQRRTTTTTPAVMIEYMMITVVIVMMMMMTVHGLTISQRQLLKYSYLGQYEEVLYYMNRVTTCNYEDQDGNTPLTMSIHGYYDHLHHQQPQEQQAPTTMMTMLSPYHNNHTIITKLLLNQRYDPYVMDIDYGNGRALHCACHVGGIMLTNMSSSSLWPGEEETTTLAEDSSAPWRRRNASCHPVTRTGEVTAGATPTVINHWDDMIRLLMEHGADMNCPSGMTSFVTPLYNACYRKQLPLVRLLLSTSTTTPTTTHTGRRIRSGHDHDNDPLPHRVMVDVNCYNNHPHSKQTALHAAIMPHPAPSTSSSSSSSSTISSALVDPNHRQKEDDDNEDDDNDDKDDDFRRWDVIPQTTPSAGRSSISSVMDDRSHILPTIAQPSEQEEEEIIEEKQQEQVIIETTTNNDDDDDDDDDDDHVVSKGNDDDDDHDDDDDDETNAAVQYTHHENDEDWFKKFHLARKWEDTQHMNQFTKRRMMMNQQQRHEYNEDISYHIVAALLEKGCHHVNTPDYYGDTPLHYAIRYHYPRIVQLLLSYQARMHLRNNLGLTPYSFARQHEINKNNKWHHHYHHRNDDDNNDKEYPPTTSIIEMMNEELSLREYELSSSSLSSSSLSLLYRNEPPQHRLQWEEQEYYYRQQQQQQQQQIEQQQEEEEENERSYPHDHDHDDLIPPQHKHHRLQQQQQQSQQHQLTYDFFIMGANSRALQQRQKDHKKRRQQYRQLSNNHNDDNDDDDDNAMRLSRNTESYIDHNSYRKEPDVIRTSYRNDYEVKKTDRAPPVPRSTSSSSSSSYTKSSRHKTPSPPQQYDNEFFMVGARDKERRGRLLEHEKMKRRGYLSSSSSTSSQQTTKLQNYDNESFMTGDRRCHYDRREELRNQLLFRRIKDASTNPRMAIPAYSAGGTLPSLPQPQQHHQHHQHDRRLVALPSDQEFSMTGTNDRNTLQERRLRQEYEKMMRNRTTLSQQYDDDDTFLDRDYVESSYPMSMDLPWMNHHHYYNKNHMTTSATNPSYDDTMSWAYKNVEQHHESNDSPSLLLRRPEQSTFDIHEYRHTIANQIYYRKHYAS